MFKKTGLILFFISLAVLKLSAQGTGGFFNQQAAKEKLMTIQIAEYERWLKSLKSGYNDTEKGLSAAHALKNGIFTLHRDYFNSLKQVAPAVRNNPKVKGTTDLLAQMEQTFALALAWQKDKGVLTDQEMSYLQTVYHNLFNECAQTIAKLKLVLTPGGLQMTDQQRIASIDRVYADMQEKYRFSCSFTRGAYQMASHRIDELAADQALKQSYNLNE
jgi:hypothetical protein